MKKTTADNPLKTASRVGCVEPSPPRAVFDLALTLDDVVDLTLGDPDLPPPVNVREAACRAVMAGRTRYSANAGLRELRQAVAADAERSLGIPVDPETEVVITVGAMEASFLTLYSLLEPGDEVVIHAPYWINYSQVVRSLGATPVFVNTRPEDGFVVRPEEVERRITERTRLLVLNSPANPTGAVIPDETLDRLAEVAARHDLTVVSDEIYSHLVYDGRRAGSIVTRPGMRERTVVVNGFSKRYAMTGWRVGWALGPHELIGAMTKMTENIVACAPLPSQYAALEALSPRTDESYILKEFQARRDCVLEELRSIPELRCVGIPATFYAFLDVSGTGMTGEEFALELLKSRQVALIHGSAYGGEAYRDFVRIAFTLGIPELREAFSRIREFLAERKGVRK